MSIAPTTDATPAEPTRHEQIAAGLRQLADFIQAHPDFPVPAYPTIQHCVGSKTADGQKNDEVGVATVRQIAAALGVPAEVGGGGHHVVHAAFGVVGYTAFYVPDASYSAHLARTSYERNVQLEGGESR
jgi:hypothetical protein